MNQRPSLQFPPQPISQSPLIQLNQTSSPFNCPSQFEGGTLKLLPLKSPSENTSVVRSVIIKAQTPKSLKSVPLPDDNYLAQFHNRGSNSSNNENIPLSTNTSAIQSGVNTRVQSHRQRQPSIQKNINLTKFLNRRSSNPDDKDLEDEDDNENLVGKNERRNDQQSEGKKSNSSSSCVCKSVGKPRKFSTSSIKENDKKSLNNVSQEHTFNMNNSNIQHHHERIQTFSSNSPSTCNHYIQNQETTEKKHERSIHFLRKNSTSSSKNNVGTPDLRHENQTRKCDDNQSHFSSASSLSNRNNPQNPRTLLFPQSSSELDKSGISYDISLSPQRQNYIGVTAENSYATLGRPARTQKTFGSEQCDTLAVIEATAFTEITSKNDQQPNSAFQSQAPESSFALVNQSFPGMRSIQNDIPDRRLCSTSSLSNSHHKSSNHHKRHHQPVPRSSSSSKTVSPDTTAYTYKTYSNLQSLNQINKRLGKSLRAASSPTQSFNRNQQEDESKQYLDNEDMIASRPISKNLQRIQRQMGDAFFSMKRINNSTSTKYNNPQESRHPQLLQQEKIGAATFCQLPSNNANSGRSSHSNSHRIGQRNFFDASQTGQSTLTKIPNLLTTSGEGGVNNSGMLISSSSLVNQIQRFSNQIGGSKNVIQQKYSSNGSQPDFYTGGMVLQQNQIPPHHNHHHRMKSNQTIGSQQASATTLTMMDKNLCKNYTTCTSGQKNQQNTQIIDEQAQVIRNLNTQLRDMEAKNQEYMQILRQLSFRILGDDQVVMSGGGNLQQNKHNQQQQQQLQEDDQQTKVIEKQNERDNLEDQSRDSGGILVSRLIQQMHHVENQKQMLRNQISDKEENTRKIKQSYCSVLTQLEQADTENSQIKKELADKNQELIRKHEIMNVFSQKVDLLDDTEQVLSHILNRMKQQFPGFKGSCVYRNDVTVITKAKQIEDFIFSDFFKKRSPEQINDLQIDRLNKLRAELLMYKQRLKQDEGTNQQQFIKLKEQIQRQKSYIQLIERELQMQKMVSKTKRILSQDKTEDRVRQSFPLSLSSTTNNSKNPSFLRNSSQMYKRRSSLDKMNFSSVKIQKSSCNQSFEEQQTRAMLDTSYDSILDKLGSLQHQIQNIKDKNQQNKVVQNNHEVKNITRNQNLNKTSLPMQSQNKDEQRTYFFPPQQNHHHHHPSQRNVYNTMNNSVSENIYKKQDKSRQYRSERKSRKSSQKNLRAKIRQSTQSLERPRSILKESKYFSKNNIIENNNNKSIGEGLKSRVHTDGKNTVRSEKSNATVKKRMGSTNNARMRSVSKPQQKKRSLNRSSVMKLGAINKTFSGKENVFQVIDQSKMKKKSSKSTFGKKSGAFSANCSMIGAAPKLGGKPLNVSFQKRPYGINY